MIQACMYWFIIRQNLDIVLGDYKFRNWRVALKELNYYLQETPLVPVNVSYTEENKIENYFKNE